ncbi:HAD family hydrolase [Sporosarcina sp. FSL K6-1522]|uniref:HAD family hydrolase n=1 Tax=Sporosarcina sp. FSL K6-1522 TaxID=2921554 RepID=UPI003159E7E6
MILFTSDLDRTLIYSKRMMENYPVDGDIIPIEYKGDDIISYMSLDSIEMLRQFNEKQLFVPVTTRAVYQYERIEVFQNDIQPKYAITSNGGTILVDGKVDEEWGKLIQQRIAATAIPNEDLLRVFADIRHEEWVAKEFYVDALFYMFHVHLDRIPHAELRAFESRIGELGWRLFLHGRKLYILPTELNKAHAVDHLQKYLTYDMHVAAGDSLMDYDMLLQADIGYSPAHGEIFERRENDSKVAWINAAGATSTEDLLRNILQLD